MRGECARARLSAIGRACPVTAFVIALTIGLGPAHAQNSPAQISPTLSLDSDGSARPIQGWVDFCARVPAECEVQPDEPTAITLSRDAWQLLVRVNERVNATIKPMSDRRHWGVLDRWDLPDDGYGDCEDYQLLKRKLLAKEGLPRRAMRMTVVIDEWNEGHAVLTIRTDRGDFILDNRTDAVLPWHATGYAFIKREGDGGGAWVSLERLASPVMTAAR
jgi:predicted transglutaminase-like cysteine proteinase